MNAIGIYDARVELVGRQDGDLELAFRAWVDYILIASRLNVDVNSNLIRRLRKDNAVECGTSEYVVIELNDQGKIIV